MDVKIISILDLDYQDNIHQVKWIKQFNWKLNLENETKFIKMHVSIEVVIPNLFSIFISVALYTYVSWIGIDTEDQFDIQHIF